ncbi:MAG: LL-diaminopimelate aminotransferase [Tumebacillaceae bacterium]
MIDVKNAADPYIQQLFAERIGGAGFGKNTAIYKFEKIKQAKAAARLKHPGVELLDLGVGEPDWMADAGAVEVLGREAAVKENRWYTDNGSREFNAAAAAYMENVFGVQGLNPETEINHCIGSKAALAQLPAAFINPGDVTLMTAPGYPVIATHTAWFGGEVVKLPLKQENGYLPDLDALPEDVKKRAKLLYLNYPNNPTGAVASREFYEKVIEFAKKYEVIVISDEAYAGLVFDGEEPLSFLAVPGAKEVGVSLQSLSKAFNMTGWRLGFVAGNELIVRAFASVKDNHDSGQFMAIQKAGIYCLQHPEITVKTSEKYGRRHRLLVDVLKEFGFDANMPKGSFYLYVKAPKGVVGGPEFETAEDFSQYLITELLISTVPWDDVAPYVRFSVTFEAKDENDELRVMDELKKRLANCEFIW